MGCRFESYLWSQSGGRGPQVCPRQIGERRFDFTQDWIETAMRWAREQASPV